MHIPWHFCADACHCQTTFRLSSGQLIGRQAIFGWLSAVDHSAHVSRRRRHKKHAFKYPETCSGTCFSHILLIFFLYSGTSALLLEYCDVFVAPMAGRSKECPRMHRQCCTGRALDSQLNNFEITAAHRLKATQNSALILRFQGLVLMALSWHFKLFLFVSKWICKGCPKWIQVDPCGPSVVLLITTRLRGVGVDADAKVVQLRPRLWIFRFTGGATQT